MKQAIHFFLLLILLGSGHFVAAQVKVGGTPGTPHPAAVLELQSNSKGLLLPRLTTPEMLGMATDAQSKGLVVYNTDSSRVFVFDGALWRPQALATPSGWLLTGNVGVTPFQFLGNIDSMPLYFRTHNQLRMSVGATGNVGIGTGNAISALDLFNYGSSDEKDDLNIRSYNNSGGPALLLYRARLNGVVPTNLQNGDFLGVLNFAGEIGGNTTDLSSIIANYTGNGTTVLSSLSFRTSGNQGMLLNDKGWLTIGNSNASAGATADIQGSLRYKLTSPFVTTYTLASTDLVVLVNATSGPNTINLPSSADFDGHFIVIKNNKTSAVTLSAGIGTLLCNGGGTGCSSLAAQRVIGLVAQFTGTNMNWIQVF